MLGRGGQRHGAGRRKVADAARAPGQLPQHGAPGPVAEGVEDGIEIGVLLFNHVVEYEPAHRMSQPLGLMFG